MHYMLKCLDIAYYFLALKDYDDLTNLKIQKMLYCAQGMHLSLYRQPLFNELIEAWEHGPVIPTLYNEFKEFKNRPIPPIENFNLSNLDNKEKFLDKAYTKYGAYNASQLYKLTHFVFSPWDLIYDKDQSSNYIINNQLIRVYFEEIMKLEQEKDIDSFKAATILSKDKAMQETMYILSDLETVQKIEKALIETTENKTIEFDWKNAN